MTYIYQLGYCAISQGEDLTEAIQAASAAGFDITGNDVLIYRGDESQHCDGDVVYSMDEIPGY